MVNINFELINNHFSFIKMDNSEFDKIVMNKKFSIFADKNLTGDIENIICTSFHKLLNSKGISYRNCYYFTLNNISIYFSLYVMDDDYYVLYTQNGPKINIYKCDQFYGLINCLESIKKLIK